MRSDGTTNLRRAKSIKIGFLSGVTAPAHEGANVLLTKVRYSNQTEGISLLKSVFTSALDEMKLKEQVGSVINNTWQLNEALRETAEDIAKDESITDKQEALRQSVNEYIMTLQTAVMGSIMSKAKKTEDGVEFPASDYAYVPDVEKPSTWKLRLTSTPGGEPDARIVGAAVAALGKGFRGNKVEIPEADLEKVINKVRAAWLKANPEKTTEDLPSVLEKQNMSELEKYKSLAEMSDIHKTYHNNLPECDQESFRKMASEARDATIEMAKPPVDESFETLTGQTVSKSKSGDLYQVLKSQDLELRKARKESELNKALNTVNAEFTHLPGTPVEKANQLIAINAMPESIRDEVLKQMRQSDALWKARRDPAAPLGDKTGDDKTKMEALITEWVRANPGKTRSQAMQAISNTPEGKKLNAAIRGEE
jgi:hypothetical protein